MIFLRNEGMYYTIFGVSKFCNALRNLSEKRVAESMRQKIRRDVAEDEMFLKTALIPHFSFGCNIILLSDDYIQSKWILNKTVNVIK